MIRGFPAGGCARWLACLFLFIAATPLAAGPDQAILWEIRDERGRAGFLFGTVHSDRPDVIRLPEPVREAFRESRRFAFELDFGAVDERSLSRLMRLEEGQSLPDILPSDLWQRVQDAARRVGIPAPAMRRQKPWAIAVALSLPPANPEGILDHALQSAARDRGHEVLGLETVAEQLSILDDLDRRHQVGMLRLAVEQLESGETGRLHAELVDAWKARDLDRIARLTERSPSIPDQRANRAFMERMLRERNERMVARMQPLLDARNAFIAVGALHLVGDRGLVRLLEQRGYLLIPAY